MVEDRWPSAGRTRGSNRLMAEQSTSLFVPPVPSRRATVAVGQVPVLTPSPRLNVAAVLIGAAMVDRSSRISQRMLVRALGWHSGYRLRSQ